MTSYLECAGRGQIRRLARIAVSNYGHVPRLRIILVHFLPLGARRALRRNAQKCRSKSQFPHFIWRFGHRELNLRLRTRDRNPTLHTSSDPSLFTNSFFCRQVLATTKTKKKKRPVGNRSFEIQLRARLQTPGADIHGKRHPQFTSTQGYRL